MSILSSLIMFKRAAITLPVTRCRFARQL